MSKITALQDEIVKCPYCKDSININDTGGIQIYPETAHTRCVRVCKNSRQEERQDIIEKINILKGAFWASTDFIVDGKLNKDLEEYSMKVIDNFCGHLIKELEKDKI